MQEYTRRKLALEKSLQHGVRSRHLALNDKYMELMEYMGCPWVQSVLPVSLACDDLGFWITRIKYSMPRVSIPARLRELAGLSPEPDNYVFDGDMEDDSLRAEPMDLKRRAMSMGERSDSDYPSTSSTASTAFRMVQMSIIMGFKVRTDLLVTICSPLTRFPPPFHRCPSFKSFSGRTQSLLHILTQNLTLILPHRCRLGITGPFIC